MKLFEKEIDLVFTCRQISFGCDFCKYRKGKVKKKQQKKIFKTMIDTYIRHTRAHVAIRT